MKSDFGDKVKKLRKERNITREEFCGDETRLSIRQLARIEAGDSTPNLDKAQFIAETLGVGLSQLTDGKSLELPKRYKELKYQILRLPTYSDEERLKIREDQLDEILNNYYDDLPETEQILIDIIQARFEVSNTQNVNFGVGVLNDYFEQVKKKKSYGINDLALIDLYLVCASVSSFKGDIYDKDIYDYFVKNLLEQGEKIEIKDLFFLNKLYLMICSAYIKKMEYTKLDSLLEKLYQLIIKSQDFQRMPLYYMFRWKYSLYFLQDKYNAEEFYTQAIIFSEMTQDMYLVKQLQTEWNENLKKFLDN